MFYEILSWILLFALNVVFCMFGVCSGTSGSYLEAAIFFFVAFIVTYLAVDDIIGKIFKD